MKKLALIDGNSLINRAFYAMPLLKTKNGVYTNAVYGFTSMLLKLIDELQPDYMVVAFDRKEKTFRHLMYDGYKANRHGMPDELANQMPILKHLLSTMNIKMVEQDGIEADDIIGTLSKKFDVESYILTGDKDSLQLIDDKTNVWLTKKGITELIKLDEKGLYDYMELKPYQIIEYKSLAGDSSDCIPGVSGVGEKTAISLLHEYDSLDGVYSNIENISGKLKEKLINNKEMAYLSHELATIKLDCNLDVNLEDCLLYNELNDETLKEFEELEFTSLLKRENRVSIKGTDIVQTVISSKEELENALRGYMDAKYFAFDSESFSFAFFKGENYTLKVEEGLLSSFSYDNAYDLLKPIFESEIEKILFNSKHERYELDRHNIKLNNVKYDINIMQYLVDFSSKLNNLDSVLEHHNIDEKAKAAGLIILKEELEEEMEKQNLKKVYDVELPLSYVLYDMEKTGFKIDTNILDELDKELTDKTNELTNKIYEAAGVGNDWNINSPKQLGEVLFNQLGLRTGKKTHSGYSTDIDALERIKGDHEVVPLIIEYRQVYKLLSTYIKAIRPLISSDGKLHTDFKQTATATGRLASSDPNLQNIPVRDKLGREIRRMFVPSDNDYILLSSDYSQIELRLLAHFANDEGLIEAYKEGKDVHAATAAKVFKTPLDQVTKQQRSNAKAVNFGIIYGISDYGLSQGLDITVKEAKEYIEEYFKTYPKVKEYMDGNVEFAKKHGYVLTLLNRRRKIMEINSTNYTIRSFGERAAMNMPLQGSSADIIKIAMLNVFNRLRNEGLKSKIILQVHDELIIDTLKEEKEKVTAILREEMENAVELRVPLIVDINEGATWYEAK